MKKIMVSMALVAVSVSLRAQDSTLKKISGTLVQIQTSSEQMNTFSLNILERLDSAIALEKKIINDRDSLLALIRNYQDSLTFTKKKMKYERVSNLSHRTPFHKEGRVSFDVLHLVPNEWSPVFFAEKSKLFYSFLTDDTVNTQRKVYYRNSAIPVLLEDLSQDAHHVDSTATAYQWMTRTGVDVVVIQFEPAQIWYMLKQIKHLKKKYHIRHSSQKDGYEDDVKSKKNKA